MRNKRGELTTQQIVTLVILITSFAIILFFIFRLGLGEETDKEICHNSVVTRALSILPADTVPLKCKKEYVCLTADGTCEKMTSPVIKKVGDEQELYGVLADQLADCWWMFGEGELNYAGDAALSTTHYCSLCSQIAFDDSIKDEIFAGQDTFSRAEFFDYMNKHEVKEGITYHQYLYDYRMQEFNIDYSKYGSYSLDSQYYAMMGITDKISDYTKWAFAGVAVVGLVVATPIVGPSSLVLGSVLFGAGSAGGTYFFLTPVLEGKSGLDYTRASLVEVNSNEFKALGCEEISSLS